MRPAFKSGAHPAFVCDHDAVARLDLEVRFETLDQEGDPIPGAPWPSLRLLINGEDRLAQAWEGMGRDPDSLLTDDSPLIPPPTGSRDVRLYRCTCADEGCGSLIARVRYENDEVIWDGFRDGSDITFRGEPVEGLDEFHFDVAQYVEAVRKAHDNRPWESTDRRAARFVRERIADTELRQGWKFIWAAGHNFELGSAHRRTAGVSVTLSRGRRQIVVGFDGDTSDPSAFANRVVATLQGDPHEWRITFDGGSVEGARISAVRVMRRPEP